MNTSTRASASPGIWLAVALAGIAAIFAVLAYVGGNTPGGDWQARATLAAELQNNKLFTAAIEEYTALTDNPAVPIPKRANYAFAAGEIYLDELADYENAAAFFIRARSLDPRPGLDLEIGQRLVECFENLGRVFDAARQLADYTAPDGKKKATPGDVVVARVGEREITLSEIENELQKLPPQVQAEFTTPAKKLEFVRQYIGMELLYKSAIRRGLDRTPEIRQQVADIKRQLILDKMLQEEILAGITVSNADLEFFFKAHQADLFAGRELVDIRVQVEQEYRRVKQREKYSEMIDKLIDAEPVTVYEQHLK